MTQRLSVRRVATDMVEGLVNGLAWVGEHWLLFLA